MSEEKLKSKIEQASGVIKEGTGKLTGDKELEAKGFVEKTIAKGKELVDDAKEAVSGCMPAYVYMYIEAAADAAVSYGMKRDMAYRVISQAVAGSAKMVRESGIHPGELKDQVTTPGGTTIKGVKSLEKDGFRSAIINAVDSIMNK